MQPSQDTAKHVDGVCDRFESQWLADKRPRIEDYLSAVPATLRAALFRGLLPVELELLRKAGKAPIEADYLKRFPADASLISEIFKAHATKKAGASETSVSTSGARTASFHAPDLAKNDATPAQIGRFKVLAVLGQGAFGRVYKAHDPKLDRHVAIKVPLQSTLGSPEEVDRFLHEARAAATLHHPNLCPVHEVGQDDNGAYYIVMAFVEGTTLSAFLRERKEPVAAKQAALIVRKLALALGAAHAKGIVHRDLKPANIMVGRERKDVIIMDFGLARHRKDGDAQETREGVVMGTPAYMSPEQARGDVKAIGPASDIYGLGIILYEMLAGKVPFSGSVTEVLGKVLHVEPEPPSTHRAGVDPQLEAICMKALSKAPAERFASMKAFADAMEGFLKGTPSESITTRPKAKASESAGLSQVVEALSAERKQERQALEKTVGKHSRNLLLVVVAAFAMLGLLIVAGGSILFFFRTPTTLVQITLVTELGIDPAQMKDAKIAYYLNDKLLAADELLRPIELQAGEHILVAKRDGVEIQRWEFVVQLGRDDKDAKVEIKPGSSPKSKYPEDLLKNLNERAIDDNFPFLTPDGLSIYYAREGGTHGPSAIYHARRVAVKQPFGKPTRVFNGRHVAVTADECYAVVLAEGMPAPLLELKRASTNAPWGAPTPIAEFKLDWNMKSPWLAPDGLSLVFNRNRTVAAYPSKITELVIARRAKRQDPWGQVQLLPMSIDPKFDDAFTWARLSDDLKTVWFSIGGGRDTARLMTASRPDAQSSFGGYRNVELDGKPIQGQGAFYISATKELFWSQDTTGTKADRDLRMALLELPAADSDGWTPLFNGKDLTGWTIESGDAESWKVRDNAIVTTGTGGLADETWLLSEKAYGDCIVRMEFLAESASVNSGVAIRVVPGERPTLGDPPTRTNRPQHLQIEIFGTAKTGGKLETGTVLSGFGPEVVLKSNPLDKQKPAGEWNLMEIETRGQAIRVRLNGELVLDGSLDDLIDRGGLYPGLRRKIGRIGFQRLGGTVRFRNIRIKELASPEEAGFVPLFNGKDLTGWKTHPDQPGDWQVKDGLLIGRFSEPSNLFSQRGDYKRFHLRVEAKLNQDGDSGINFRSEYGLSFKGKLGTRYPLGYQAQMVHSHKLPTSSLTGSLAKIGQDWLVTVKEQLVRPGEWYLHEVIVDGKRIVIKVNGKTTADIPDDDPAFASGHLALQVTWPETTVVHFKKIEIKELPPDDGGFVPLFNGKDLTGWQGLVPINARKKMTPEQYQAAVKKANEAMQEHWIVKDGVLHYDGKNDNLQTVKDYGNFELYADWKIGPNGDSGIYLRGYPQVQIWDINRKSNTKKVGSGGLYNNLNNPSSALMVADNPIGEWNTFHIVMIDDKVTVKLNGKLVVDNTTLENHWERGLPLPARGPIELQHHGDQLWFKNIFIKELPDTPVQAPRDAKWVARHESFIDIAKKGDVDVLFLGDSITDGWRGESGKSVWDKAFGRLKPANFGIGGDRTEHLLWRIQNGELDGITPKVAVVLIGTNNTLNESAEQIAEGIGAIVHTIRVKSPTTKVLVLGIFPRGKTIPNALNNKIIEANKFIAKLDDGKNVKYLNIGQKFMKAGQIPDAIMYDHLQLTAAGYQIWADALTPTLRTMLGAGKK